MDPATAVSAFALLLLAELGDKTQLMAMSLAHRHRAGPVLIGICAAFLVLDVLAVGVGAGLYKLVPETVVLVVAGVLFLAFGGHILRSGVEDEEASGGVGTRGGWRVAAASFGLIFVAELGDKTQLAMVTMAAATGEGLAVLVGGTLALWTISVLGVLVGATLLRRFPVLWVHRGAAVLFFAFGGWALLRAASLII